MIRDCRFVNDAAVALSMQDGSVVGKPRWRAAIEATVFLLLTQVSGEFSFLHNASEQMHANDRVYTFWCLTW